MLTTLTAKAVNHTERLLLIRATDEKVFTNPTLTDI
jgi:hypothetical protein